MDLSSYVQAAELALIYAALMFNGVGLLHACETVRRVMGR